jgi:hypothetical protein
MIFKRPNTTVRVFEAIRAARPAKLFIAADAPQIIKVLWWFSRRFHDRSNANS